MPRKADPRYTDPFYVPRPDYIPENEEYLYPHLTGIHQDFIPDKDTGPAALPEEPAAKARAKKE